MKKVLSCFICLGVFLMVFLGCTKAENKTSGESGVYKFAFLPNTQNNTFQTAMNDTFRRLCQENGYGYTCLDPDYDLNTQLSQLADAANQGFDMVFVIPVDSAGIRQGLNQLREKGIRVINVDTPVVNEDLDLVESVIATDCYMAGVLVGEEMVRRHPNGAGIAILDFPANESCVDRVNGFLKGLGDNRNKFNIVAQQDGKAALDVSMPIAEDIIQANPKLEAFFCINDPSAMGAAAAIKATGKTNIEVYSIDASPDGKAALLDGSFTAVAAQVPIKIAETSFLKAQDLLAGKAIEERIMLPSLLVSMEMARQTLNDWQ